MSLKIGIVGLPNVGKSTIFNALTSAGSQVANYPFATIDPHVGIVDVPDSRLDKLAEIVKPERIVHATLEVVDIAGLVKGANKGEGLGNQFLDNIRRVDAIIHVVRAFQDPDVVHVSGKVDPRSDIEVINTELLLADMQVVERRLEKVSRMAKSGEKKLKEEVEFLRRLLDWLNRGKKIINMELNEEEKEWLKSMHLLTTKKMLYVINVDEEGWEKKEEHPLVGEAVEYIKEEGSDYIIIYGKMEAEISELEPEDREDFLKEAGIAEPGLNKVIREGYDLLDLITFFTAGKPEVRAWTIKRGTSAPEAAGTIHSDFQRGFIKAEVIPFEEFIKYGSMAGAREAGAIRMEGKDYIVQDGDVIYFRFNV